MVTTNNSFITQMKLRELREQRSRSMQAYTELRQQVAAAVSETEQLHFLYDGLRQLKFANQELHPDVANMEPLLDQDNGQAISVETLNFWRQQLEKELTGGQLRAEIIYVFGALLEEWATRTTESAQTRDQRVQQQKVLLERLLEPAPTGNYKEVLNTLLNDFALSDAETRAQQFQEAVGSQLRERVNINDLVRILKQLSDSPYHSPELRKQAQSFTVDHIMQKELADALTIMLEHMDEWQRPQEGVPARAHWALSKWRLFIDDDLPTACFLELLGQRWNTIFEQFFLYEREARLKQFSKHQHSNDNAWYVRKMMDKINPGLRTSSLSEVDIWQPETNSQKHTINLVDENWDYGSIFEQRIQLKSTLYEIEQMSRYDSLESHSGMEIALMVTNAEIHLAQAAPTPTPLHILKIDLQNFYASLSHQMLLDVLESYGLTASQLAFFSKFLSIPMQHQGSVVTSQRGIPNNHYLSHTLGELVMGLFEQYVQHETNVQIFRLVDDVCLLTPSETEMARAWQALQTFCQAFGLILNPEKCGAICVGGERLDTLPAAQPGWMLLTLDQQGQWNVNWDAFEGYLNEARQQVLQAPSLVAQIEIYNTHLKYLIKALALGANLGITHRQNIGKAMERFSNSFFAEQQGMPDAIRQAVNERFLGQNTTTHVPEAWLYWPISAGGCGLLQAPILAASYAVNFAQQKQIAVPEERVSDWQYQRDEEWSAFYSSLNQEIEAAEPKTNQVMQVLVKDFIRRGSEMSNRDQDGLTTYWRWILAIYGPQILDQLGTFRFLITDLVPLQLIVHKYRQQDNE